jgi:hypothetical protein
MIAFTDREGTPLSGGMSYWLHLLPNIPSANLCSVTLYEAENASGLANGRPFPSLGSRDEPAVNSDGSTISISVQKHPRAKKRNWLAMPGRRLFCNPSPLLPNRVCDQ